VVISKKWDQGEIVPEMGNVTVKHQGNAPAWGALYWQYYEDMDKVRKSDASLDIEKQLFVEKPMHRNQTDAHHRR